MTIKWVVFPLISNRSSHISDRKIESIAYMWWKGKEITNRWCICLLELCQIDGSGVLERVLPRRVNRCHSVVVAHYYSEALHSLRFIEFCNELGQVFGSIGYHCEFWKKFDINLVIFLDRNEVNNDKKILNAYTTILEYRLKFLQLECKL